MTIAEELERRGEKIGEKIGEIKGAQRRDREIALALLGKGLDKALIAQTTNLELAKVEELSRKDKSKS